MGGASDKNNWLSQSRGPGRWRGKPSLPGPWGASFRAHILPGCGGKAGHIASRAFKLSVRVADRVDCTRVAGGRRASSLAAGDGHELSPYPPHSPTTGVPLLADTVCVSERSALRAIILLRAWRIHAPLLALAHGRLATARPMRVRDVGLLLPGPPRLPAAAELAARCAVRLLAR